MPALLQADDPRLQRLQQSRESGAFESRPRHRDVASAQIVSRRRHVDQSDSDDDQATPAEDDEDESSDTEVDGDVAHDTAPDAEEEEALAARRAAVRER